MYSEFTKFEKILLQKNNPVGTSILLLLIWIACSDDDLDNKELDELYIIADSSNHRDEIHILIDLIKSNDYDSIQLASEIIRTHVESSKGVLFLEMSIGVAVADGRLKVSENYILRYIADLFTISAHELNEIFKNITTKNLPEPEDLSSYKYWGYSEFKSGQDNRNRAKSNHSMSRIKALSVLGLDEEASIEEIKKTYRRLAQVHHPDKFSSLGEEAVQAATATFQRITIAYNYLIQNA